MVGTDLYAHIRNLLPTTLPAFLLALLAYGVLGRSTGDALDDSTVALLRATLESHFVFHPCSPCAAVVLAAALLRMPALPGIFFGVIAGALVAWLVQDATVATLLRTLMEGYQPATGEPLVDTLLEGGLLSMTWVILLIFVSMIFGGLLEATGCLDRILNALIRRLHSRFRLFAAAFLSTLGLNVASNIFVTLAVNGRLFAPVFRGAGYGGVNLSRTLEDGGTLSSPLIPWNAGGSSSQVPSAYQRCSTRPLPSPTGSPWGWICCTPPSAASRPKPTRRKSPGGAGTKSTFPRGPAHNCRRPTPKHLCCGAHAMSPSLSDPTGGLSTHDAALDARNETIKIWINGELVPRAEAKVSVYDSGFLLGDGMWEGCRSSTAAGPFSTSTSIGFSIAAKRSSWISA